MIELLIVVAIIAILAGFLFPVFSQAHETARKAQCASNLKQLGVAVQMYRQDNDEVHPLTDGAGNNRTFFDVPPNVRGGTASTFSRQASNWANALQPYVKNWGVYLCPSAALTTDLNWSKAIPAGQTEIQTSYTYNGLLANSSDAVVNQPAWCILFWEGFGRTSLRNYAGSSPMMNGPLTAYPSYATATSCAFLIPSAPNSYYVHGNGSNYLFADGHVKFRPMTADREMTPWISFDTATGKINSLNAWPAATANNPATCPYLFRPNGP